MNAVEVSPVRDRSDLAAFVELPWALYRGDPNWIPPIRSEVSSLLTPGDHPFWNHGERELFLARRDGRVVGRVAAIVDHTYNACHSDRMGTFGFFESDRDPQTAQALFSTAARWLTARGMRSMQGPLNPSTNYEVGLLVEGFDSPPSIMMPYNPSYYADLIPQCGFQKEKDLFSFLYEPGHPMPDWIPEHSRRLREESGVTIRTSSKKTFEPDLRLMNRVYGECWSKNWGFVPMTDEEFARSARTLVHIVDFDVVFFLCCRNEPIGVCLILPDINPLLRRFDGSLGLLSILKMYYYWSSDVSGARMLLFGVKEEYRQMGLSLVAFDYLIGLLARKPRCRYLEVAWTLEDNEAVNSFFRKAGIPVHKRYRIYSKDLERDRSVS